MKRPSANVEKEGEEEEPKTDDMAEEPEKTDEEEKEKEKTPVKAKAKAKNKAKSKAKSKAKAKPKTAPKQKKEKEKKEKKGKKEKNEEEEEAPKKENLNDKCEKWKAAVDGAETDQKEDSEEDTETRDRGKSRKFQKLKDAGPIPDHILAMFEHESKKQDKPRSYKTALINRLFKSDGKGGYESSVLASQFLNPKTHLVLQARGQHECAQDFGAIMLQRD